MRVSHISGQCSSCWWPSRHCARRAPTRVAALFRLGTLLFARLLLTFTNSLSVLISFSLDACAQIIYTFVDVLSKPVVGFMVWVVAARLAETRQQNGLLTGDGVDAPLSASVAVDAEAGLAAAADK